MCVQTPPSLLADHQMTCETAWKEGREGGRERGREGEREGGREGGRGGIQCKKSPSHLMCSHCFNCSTSNFLFISS